MESERRSTIILSAEKGMNAYLQVLPLINTLGRGKDLGTLDNESYCAVGITARICDRTASAVAESTCQYYELKRDCTPFHD
jgi:hypothetical protein